MVKCEWLVKDLFNEDVNSQWSSFGLVSGDWMNDDWYKLLTEKWFSIIPELHGERELLVSARMFREHMRDSELEFKIFLRKWVNRRWFALFSQNQEWYNHLFDTLHLQYNPLYNVDGEEIRSYTKTNTGTQDNENVLSGSERNVESLSGSETRTHGASGSITDTTNYNGQERIDTDYLGSEIENHGGHITDQVKTFDSGTFQDLSNHANDLVNTKSFNDREDITAKTFLNRNDQNVKTFNNYQEMDTLSFNNRQNENVNTYNNVTNTNNRIDDFEETYEERLQRFGNIGVTKSTDLVESELLLREKWKVLDVIIMDMVNAISYAY